MAEGWKVENLPGGEDLCRANSYVRTPKRWDVRLFGRQSHRDASRLNCRPTGFDALTILFFEFFFDDLCQFFGQGREIGGFDTAHVLPQGFA